MAVGCVFLNSYILEQTVPALTSVLARSSLPSVCVSAAAGARGKSGGVVYLGGGDAGLSYPADICRPLHHKARKISLLGANNLNENQELWKPPLDQVPRQWPLGRKRSQGPPRRAWELSHGEGHTRTFKSTLCTVNSRKRNELKGGHVEELDSDLTAYPVEIIPIWAKEKQLPCPEWFLISSWSYHTMPALSRPGPRRVWPKRVSFPFKSLTLSHTY